MARSPRASSRSQTLGAGACRLLFFCVAAVALTAHSAAATCSTASDCSTCMNSYGTTGEGACRWCDSTEECVDVTTLEADDDDDDDGSGGSGSNSWSRNDDADSGGGSSNDDYACDWQDSCTSDYYLYLVATIAGAVFCFCCFTFSASIFFLRTCARNNDHEVPVPHTAAAMAWLLPT